MPRRVLTLTIPLVGALLLAGCASSGTGTAGTVQVMASFYPLQFVAEQVGGDRVTVSSLTPPGAEPHDVELSPSQVDGLGRSDLLVYLSGFQPAVDDAVAVNPPAEVVDAADHTDLVPAGAHPSGTGSGEQAAAGGTGQGVLDPHFWLDPSRVPAVVDAVAQSLSSIDPDGAPTYRANAATLDSRLAELDAAYRTGLATCSTRVLVTTHDAFGYLADRYDLREVGIAGIDPQAEPSPARLAEIGRIVRDEGVTTIFFETLASPAVAQALATELGVRTAVLDPIEGRTDDSQDYLSLAQANLDALRTALGCA